MIREIERFAGDDSGAVSAWSLFWSLCFIMLGGFAVDYTNAIRIRTNLQTTADASALAAALRLNEYGEEAATERALDLAALNMPVQSNGQVLVEDDVLYGTWDAESRHFSAGEEPYNAVAVTTRRQEESGNYVPTFLLRLAGIGSWDITAQSIALTEASISCDGGEFTSDIDGTLYGANTLSEGFCFHAENAVYGGGYGANHFETGARVSSPLAENFINFDTSDENFMSARVLTSKQTSLPAEIEPLYLSLLALDESWTRETSMVDLPAWVERVRVIRVGEKTGQVNDQGAEATYWGGYWGIGQWTGPLQEGTLYIVEDGGSIGIEGGFPMSNVGFVTAGSFQHGGSTSFDNVMIVTLGTIASGGASFGSGADYCASGSFNTYMFGRDGISMPGGNGFYGVLAASQGDISLGGGIAAGGGVLFESETLITLGGGANLVGCGFNMSDELGFGLGGGGGDAATSLVF